MSDRLLDPPRQRVFDQTGRSVDEWIGKTPDTDPPRKVKLRVLFNFGNRCAGCGTEIRSGIPWTCDHTKAVINGGQNREINLRPICNKVCLRPKDRADVAEKSQVFHKRSAHFGLKPRKGRPMPGSRASGLKKRMDGTVVKR
jgi:5-methylcytosine-specific restriction protein A